MASRLDATPPASSFPHRTTMMQPHIVMVLGDDIGWANVGWHSRGSAEVVTPNLDALVSEGLELDQMFAFKYCSPSRSALQTGRNPIHVNVVNLNTEHNPLDPVSGFAGIPTNMTGIAEKLTAAGYHAHAVGKWDCGMATERHTPMGRG